MTTILLLMGPPGGGKGTQAKRLEAALQLPHISTGDLFRKNIAEETTLGLKVKAIMAAGKYVDDQTVLELLFDRLAKPDCAKGCILDGFPRTLNQVNALEEQLKSEKIYAVNIEVPDEVIVERLSGRRTCSQCQHVFHLNFLQNTNSCPDCGGDLMQRPDDQVEAIQERLKIYREQTLPVINHYQKKGCLAVVDGTRSPDQVFDTIQLLLSSSIG